jgi:DNA-directed RNA polymerase subunit M/transcription elongation factor TFIIS
MEAEEMANARIKEARQQVETAKKKLEESNLTLKITVDENAQTNCLHDASVSSVQQQGLYVCPSCGSNNTKYYQFFAKGYLSEGSMQTFANCLNCQNSWKEA